MIWLVSNGLSAITSPCIGCMYSLKRELVGVQVCQRWDDDLCLLLLTDSREYTVVGVPESDEPAVSAVS